MGIAPWGALGRGQLKTKEEYDDPNRDGRKMAAQGEKYARLAAKLDEMAKKKNTAVTGIALAYVMHKAPYVFPIVGGRKVEHLKGNIGALGVELTQEEIDDIDDSEPFDVGFPQSFLFPGKPYRTHYTSNDLPLLVSNTPLESTPKPLVGSLALLEVAC